MIYDKVPRNFFVVTCPALTLANGQISYDASPVNGRYPVGATASLTCDYGYFQSGASRRTCLSSGIWDNQEEISMCKQSIKNIKCHLHSVNPFARDIFTNFC